MDPKQIAKVREKIYADYAAKTTGSKVLFERAKNSLPGGVPSSKRYQAPYPLVCEYGRGSKIYDVDNNEYINTILNAGPLLLGHDHPELMAAARKALDRGFMVQNNPLFIECAELIQQLYPAAEHVRFANTGTEAVLFAIRTARAHTGKNKIIKFYGHYHGNIDEVTPGLGGPVAGPHSAGVPAEYVGHTISAHYHDIEAVREILDREEDVAAVILDPQMNAGGILPASMDYMEALRALTRERGVVLIFDEVITGFRWAPGGAQEYYKVTPDMVVLAKAICSGTKLGVFAGKKEIMSILTPAGMPGAPDFPILAAGTFLDNPITLATAITAMKVYRRLGKEGAYERLFAKTRRFEEAAIAAFAKRGIPLQVNGMGPSLKFFVTDLEMTYENIVKNYNHTISDLFITAMTAQGVILSITSLRTIYFSFAHTDEDVDRMIEAMDVCLDRYDFQSLL